MGVLNRKVQAYTLVEILVAMSIILIVFALGLMILLNIMKYDQVVDQTRAYLIVNEVQNEIKEGNYTGNDCLSYKDFNIDIDQEPYKGNDYLRHITITVYRKKRKIYSKEYLDMSDEKSFE